MSDEPAHGLLRVVRGEPTAEEIAALVAVVAALARATAAAPTTVHRSAWADRAGLVRAPHLPGPGGWRRSARRAARSDGGAAPRPLTTPHRTGL